MQRAILNLLLKRDFEFRSGPSALPVSCPEPCLPLGQWKVSESASTNSEDISERTIGKKLIPPLSMHSDDKLKRVLPEKGEGFGGNCSYFKSCMHSASTMARTTVASVSSTRFSESRAPPRRTLRSTEKSAVFFQIDGAQPCSSVPIQSKALRCSRVSASSGLLSCRQRFILGKRIATPALCRFEIWIPSNASSNTSSGLTTRTGPNFSVVC